MNYQNDEKLIRKLTFSLFILFFCSFAYFYNGSGWNQASRMAQIYKLAENKELHINEFSHFTKDISVFGDKIYPNKPPGSTILGWLPYIIIYQIQLLSGIEIDNRKIVIINAYITNLIANQLLSSLACLLLFHIFLRFSKNITVSYLLSISFALCTLFFPYTSVYMGHTQAVSLYITGIYFLQDIILSRQIKKTHLFLGTFFSGMAVVTDFFMIYMVAFIFICIFISLKKNSQKLFLTAGIMPPVFILLSYQFICFKSPFNIPMKFNNQIFFYNKKDLFLGAYNLPHWTVINELLTGQHYGLFTFSPVLITGLLGTLIFLKNKGFRKITITLIILPFFLSLISNASFIGWWGGNTAGPRYLINLIPVLMIGSLSLIKFRFFKLILIPLMLLGFFFNLSIISTNVTPGKLKSLKYDIIPSFFSGKISSNCTAHTMAEESDNASPSNSFNLGQLFSLQGLPSIIPLLIFQLFIVCWQLIIIYKRV